MSYKTILLVLDDTEECAGRMALAASLANRMDAHLVGLFVLAFPQIPAYIEGQLDPEIFAEQRREGVSAMERVRERFESLGSQSGLTTEWRHAEGQVAEWVNLHALYADLVIVGQGNEDTLGAYGAVAGLPEQVALGAGRATLVVPYAGRFETIGRRVVVAWDARREAARAINDAMPLLKGADHVAAVTVNPRRGDEEGKHGEVAGADLALLLARHGVKVQARRIVAKSISPADVLLNQVSDEAADLLVMGAYGHSRLRETILGGVTRHILAHMTVPVLLAH